jgi:hypothetical protein
LEQKGHRERLALESDVATELEGAGAAVGEGERVRSAAPMASSTSPEFVGHQEMSSRLEERLEELFKENQQFRGDNQRLQYWLTMLESENESIGEYIALYQFQRGNIQRRLAERDQQLQQFQQQKVALMVAII